MVELKKKRHMKLFRCFQNNLQEQSSCTASESGKDAYHSFGTWKHETRFLQTLWKVNNYSLVIHNVTISLAAKPKKIQWTCTDVAVIPSFVTPKSCDAIADQGPYNNIECQFPTDPLPIDDIQVQTCSYQRMYP